MEYHAALICSVIASCHSTRRSFAPADFMRGVKTWFASPGKQLAKLAAKSKRREQ